MSLRAALAADPTLTETVRAHGTAGYLAVREFAAAGMPRGVTPADLVAEYDVEQEAARSRQDWAAFAAATGGLIALRVMASGGDALAEWDAMMGYAEEGRS